MRALAEQTHSPFDCSENPKDSKQIDQVGWRALDTACRDANQAGAILVLGPVHILTVGVSHAARRLRALGRKTLRVGGVSVCDDPMRELCARFDMHVAGEPREVARMLLERLRASALLLERVDRTTWSRAVGRELLQLAQGSTALVIATSADETWLTSGASDLHVGPSVQSGEQNEAEAIRRIRLDNGSPLDVRIWWEAAVVDVVHQPSMQTLPLDTLEGWWNAARRAAPEAPSISSMLSPLARRLLCRAHVAGRLLTEAEIIALGSADARRELVARDMLVEVTGAVDARAARYSIAPGLQLTGLHLSGLEIDDDDRRAVGTLLAQPGADPWALVRAAELSIALGDRERALSRFDQAVRATTEPTVRDDLWDRWVRCIEDTVDEDGELARSAASFALASGDNDRAAVLARLSATREERFGTLIVLGQAMRARGELKNAQVALRRAQEQAESLEDRALSDAELSEVFYLEGDHEQTREHADNALLHAEVPETRLLARNVLGKLLLARAAWVEAEHHFAEDAWEAQRAADTVAELRARLNSAIAILSSGRRDEARPALHAVLADARTHGELPAVGYALANLATLAILSHDYAEALRLTEEACSVRRRLGDRIRLSLLIANLAELRLRLGLLDEAEHALRFGRRACVGALPGSRFPQFALVAARIHLARNRTLDAANELRAAIACSGSSNGAKLCECYRTMARVHLEDGDIVRAEEAIALAEANASSKEAHADVALLQAMLARALGKPFADLAERARLAARLAEDVELIREAHVLLFLSLETDDPDTARQHLRAAERLRDQVAETLPIATRSAYLDRQAIQSLSALRDRVPADSQQSRFDSTPPIAPSSEEPCPETLRTGGRGVRSGRPSRNDEALDSVFPHASGTRPRTDEACKGDVASRRMIGDHGQMRQLRRVISRVGTTDATVLVQGESGTGKELVAEALHEASDRRDGPLVKVNCAALVETLLLSELFGHEKGSFTGASARRRGRFELADGGTLFLDEIGDISPRTQVALLRVLQEKTFERVGGAQPLKVDVRVVCATHRDLRELVRQGNFRQDLYYRLCGVTLDVPALRQRLSDLPMLAAHILGKIAKERGERVRAISTEGMDLLASYPWPGNIRELENVLRAGSLFAEGDEIRAADLQDHLRRAAPLAEAPSALESGASANATDAAYAEVRGGTSLGDLKRKLERECIVRALSESDGNITKAAQLLGMKRPRLSQLVKQHGLRDESTDVNEEVGA